MASRWALERELMEPRYRAAMRLPYGPLDLFGQVELEGALAGHMAFMKRTVYGEMLGPMAPTLMATLRDEVDRMSPPEIVILPDGWHRQALIDVTGIDRGHAPRHVTIVTRPDGGS